MVTLDLIGKLGRGDLKKSTKELMLSNIKWVLMHNYCQVKLSQTSLFIILVWYHSSDVFPPIFSTAIITLCAALGHPSHILHCGIGDLGLGWLSARSPGIPHISHLGLSDWNIPEQIKEH